MVQQQILLVLACVTWVGHGKRLQNSAGHERSRQASSQSAWTSFKAFARLLSKLNPTAAAFNPTCRLEYVLTGNPASIRSRPWILDCRHHLACHSAVPSMKVENLERRVAADQQTERDPFKSCGSIDLNSVAELIKSKDARNVIVLVGAGISVAAGIPDFRTPGTGLYDNLKEYGLPFPEAMFNLRYFTKNNSKPFYRFCRELWPGNYEPTLTHYFIRLLYDKGLLVRCYSQNIDSLETAAGLPKRALVAAHGNFDSATVYSKDESGFRVAPVPIEEVEVAAKKEDMEGWAEINAKYGGLVKPDIVFFGENLPERFYDKLEEDFPQCDLLLVLGTSLTVHPFASLVEQVMPDVPRLLINRQRVGDSGEPNMADGPAGPLNFHGETLDGFVAGDCDESVRKLVELLGWKNDLAKLVRERGALNRFEQFMRWAANAYARIFWRKRRSYFIDDVGGY